MKHRLKAYLFILVNFVCMVSLPAQNYTTKSFPRYANVVGKFFETYDWKKDFPEGDLKFEKRKDGWHISIYEYKEKEEIVKTALFWSASAKGFKDTGILKRPEADKTPDIPPAYKELWTVRAFNESPYIGYMGAEKDVIAELDGRKDLNDTLTFSLARAYSNLATDMLSRQTTFADEKDLFVVPDKRGALSSEQLAKYRAIELKAIEAFEKVKALNPLFETIVGCIALKTDNEYVNSFLELLIIQGEQEARKELPAKKLYSDFIHSYSRNLLNSCEKNALLITNGDNDTYPLLYMQASEGFRTDVRVVNMSLLQLSRYIDLLKDTVFTSPPVELYIAHADYAGSIRDYQYVKKQKDDMDLQKAFLTFKDTTYMQKSESGQILYFFPSSKIKVKTAKGTEISFKITRQYLLKNDFTLLDFIAHFEKRPLYIAGTVGSETYSDYGRHLINEGMVYHFKGRPYDGTEYASDRKIYYSNLMQKFEWKGLEKQLPAGEDLMAENYQGIFMSLANDLFEAANKDSAQAVINKSLSLFPDRVVPYGSMMAYYTDLFFRMNKEKLAMETARNVLLHISKNPYRSRTLDNLNKIAENRNSQDLKKLLKDYQNK
ncbi:MAG: hypothetical protein ACHQRM_14310 [Bacteroidia bacterium]